MSKKNSENLTDMVPAGLPPWLAKMRSVAQGAISEEDVAEIVRNQVTKAKQGDQNAIRFVFDQILGGSQLRGATFIQNNFSGNERPDQPTGAKPGTGEKLDVLRRRATAGLDLHVDGDGGEADLR